MRGTGLAQVRTGLVGGEGRERCGLGGVAAVGGIGRHRRAVGGLYGDGGAALLAFVAGGDVVARVSEEAGGQLAESPGPWSQSCAADGDRVAAAAEHVSAVVVGPVGVVVDGVQYRGGAGAGIPLSAQQCVEAEPGHPGKPLVLDAETAKDTGSGVGTFQRGLGHSAEQPGRPDRTTVFEPCAAQGLTSSCAIGVGMCWPQRCSVRAYRMASRSETRPAIAR